MMLGADKVCRPSSGGCDPAETCDGQSPSCPPDDRSSVGAVCANNSNGCLLDAFCDGSSSSCPPQYQAPDGTGCADPIIATFPPCTYDEPCGNVPHKRVVTRVDRFFKCVGGTCGIEDITLYKTCPNRNTDGTFCNDGSVCGARCGGGTCSQRIQLVCPPDAGCYCAG